MHINWESFAAYNHDARGIRFKFEDLCRQLFANENLTGNKQFRYLHANPNNYGLETEPIYDETNKRWIGFQAKFFDKDVDYAQIKHSSEKTVEYYAGKEGIVNLVYIFCNQPITSTANGYTKAVESLKKANIEIQLITDTAILDLVRNKYPYLALYYFGNYSIQPEWFVTHTSHMLDELGERYNRDFNVETAFSDELSLFINDRRASEYLNAKKANLLNEISGFLCRSDKRNYLKTLKDTVSTLTDVDAETLFDSFQWNNEVRLAVTTFLDELTEECKRLETKRDEKYRLAYDSDKNREESKEARKEFQELESQIHNLNMLIKLPDMVMISKRERQLLYGNILTISGRAGTGKSQLLASKTQSLFGEDRIALLLVAGIYFTDDPIYEQIMKNLKLDYGFENLIDILETIGEKNNCIVPFFIDALNETWNRKLWKSGLASIIDKIKRSPMVKLVLSYRPEYQKLILPDSVLEGQEDVVAMTHRGFEDNSISAVREFMNHYNIPFTPLEYFGYEMSNPLFLTLYCKTYNGEEISLPTLYNRVIEHANGNFGWLLSSSNRWLRDYTSKAMIEILKEHFQLCEIILRKFENVNDPYIIQRLYGIVFGACCKRTDDGGMQALAEYVYHTVFEQEKVYPDILLRDYARLIIERFLYEHPEYTGMIERKKIVPPYNSDPIPEIEDQCYLEKHYDGAMFWLIHSMRFEGMGMYGDFGRYVFQSALHSFDVDDKKMFNYAVYYIQKELGFSEEYFGDHDQHCGSYDRHQTIKTERIGKKYQWITMYNMLARISDHCKMVDRWNYPEEEDVKFEGAWEPYVRDFDPTLNQSFMICKDAPRFTILDEFLTKGKEENEAVDISTADAQKTWLGTKGIFLDKLKDTLILTDHNGTKWICLTKYCDTGREDLDIDNLLVWSWLYAYFVSPEQADELSRCVKKGRSVITDGTASHHQTYSVFNREYPWSPSCREFNEDAWMDVQIKTGEYEIVAETVQVPALSPIEALLRKYSGLAEEDECEVEGVMADEAGKDDFEVPEIQFKEETREREIKKKIGKILHATTDLLWEEEYDATKENAISQSLPCANLIEIMSLKQQKADGFYYDSNGMLAAFDTDLTQKINSVVVRKDILDTFLDKTGMKLVWLVDAEKEIHAADYSIAKWSEWEAVFIYEGSDITGEILKLRK